MVEYRMSGSAGSFLPVAASVVWSDFISASESGIQLLARVL